MFALRAESRPSLRPAAAVGALPLLRGCPAGEATCCPSASRCHACRRHVLVLTVPRPFRPGGVVATPGWHGIARVPAGVANYRVSFDGGARLLGERRREGAGGVLWGPVTRAIGPGSPPRRRRSPRPATPWWQKPGGFASRAGLPWPWLPRARRSPSWVTTCWSSATARGPATSTGRTCALLERPVAVLHTAGFPRQWLPVRRRYNAVADEVATDAVFWAARIGRSAHEPAVRVKYHQALAPQRAVSWPPLGRMRPTSAA